MNITEVKELIRRELPHVLQTDKAFHYVIRDMLKENFADRQKTEDRFDKVLAEIRALREESQKKWDEQQSEIRALREESQKILKEVQLFIRKYDSSIGALGHAGVSVPNSLSAAPSEAFWKSPSGCGC